MKIQVLSSYSAERYFLLSEVEQKSRLILLEEENANTFPIQLESPISVLYCKWRPILQTVDVLCDRVKDLYDRVSLKDPAACVVVVDAFIDDREAWIDEDSTLQASISTAIDTLQEITHCKHVVIGLTDNLSGVPGLEKIYETIERVDPGYCNDFPLILDIVTLNNMELMGHEPLLEADAQEGVFQVWCCSEDIAGEDNPLVRMIARKLGVDLDKKSNQKDLPAPAKAPLPGTANQWIYWVSFLIAALAALVVIWRAN